MGIYGTAPTGGPGDGIFPPTIEHITVKNTQTSRLRGNCLQLDLVNASTGLTKTPGGNAGTSMWNTVRDPTASGIQTFPLCVLEQDIAAAATGKVTFMGIIRGRYTGAGIVVGDLLEVNTSGQFVEAAAPTDRIVGIALENADATETGFVTLYFNGFGLGSQAGT